TNHPMKLTVIEALRGRKGYLTLQRLTVESYDREEYLLFSGFEDDGRALDQETLEKLFLCAAKVQDEAGVPAAVERRLYAEAERHGQATISRSLEQNSRHFHEAREKLE